MAYGIKETTSKSGFIALLLTVVIGTLLGFTGGMAKLAMEPAQVVRELPTEENFDPKANYIILGNRNGGAAYRSKMRLLTEGEPSTFAFAENELNTWSRATFTPNLEDAQGKTGISLNSPNFRILEDGRLQIVVSITIKSEDEIREVMLETTGTFAIRRGKYRFDPSETFLGSAPIPDFMAPMVNQMAFSYFAKTEGFEDLSRTWDGLTEISISEGQLIISNEI